MKRGFTLIELLVVITIIGILVALALPNFIKAKDKALEAEVKSNLHSIQISLERYATDNDGTYPGYIFGGSLSSWRCSQGDCNYAIINLQEPMMRYGFLGTYPRNPFVKTGGSKCQLSGGDPRFGCVPDGGNSWIATSGGNMANVLSDPNHKGADLNGAGVFGTNDPGGNPYYFIGDGDPKSKDFLPGDFVYRTFGSSAGDLRQWANRNTSGAALMANVYESYVLAGYGSERSTGRDYLHCYDGGFAGGNGFASRPEDQACVSYMMADLSANEPMYGHGDTDGDGDSDSIPNVVFAEGEASLVVGGNYAPTNADGQTDGLLIYFASGVDQSVGID